MATPSAEVHVDEALVRALLAEQWPTLADEPVRIVANGWDNAIARIGDEWLARLPRRAVAVPLIEHEQRWLPELAPHVPLPIPVPVHCGTPGCRYPWPWSVARWLPGRTASAQPPADLSLAAEALGGFVAALHRPAPPEAPANAFRGVALQERAAAVEARVAQLADRIDATLTLATWDTLRVMSPWAGAPVWLHGDLHPDNLLTDGGQLSAVIDFGDLTAGDPATDLAIAWMLFGPADRDRFRTALGADPHMWHRAAGWALNLSLAYLTADDTTSMPEIGRRTLQAVLDEFG